MINNFVITKNKTIKEAMRLINLNQHKCLVVVDKSRKLIGTLSDGNIRKSILNFIVSLTSINLKYYALVFNKDIKTNNPTVRIHSSCLTGDLMGSQKCDCGYQLETALNYMSKSKKMNILIYLNQEGRGLGIHNKIISYNIQEKGWDTYQADNILGFSGDERDYKAAAEILKFFKVKKLNLITNNPEKVEYLKKNKITVNKMIKIKPGINPHNKRYLETKKIIGKHLLNL